MSEANFLSDFAAQISMRYGAVTRARGCFLYTAKGVRLTDLYLDGGRAILGWGGAHSSAYTVLKNVLSRGITGSYDTYFSPRSFALDPSGTQSQTARAVSDLLASRRGIFFFTSKQAALKVALSLAPEGTSAYRPWNPAPTDWSSIPCVLITPPLSWYSPYQILAVKCDSPQDEEKLAAFQAESPTASILSEQVRVPAPLCAAITRSIRDLIRALQERREKDWFIFDKTLTKYWTRKGPYLFPKVSETRYRDFALHCLDCALVVSPRYSQPSIVPYKADPGNFRKLSNTPFTF